MKIGNFTGSQKYLQGLIFFLTDFTRYNILTLSHIFMDVLAYLKYKFKV